MQVDPDKQKLGDNKMTKKSAKKKKSIERYNYQKWVNPNKQRLGDIKTTKESAKKKTCGEKMSLSEVGQSC